MKKRIVAFLLSLSLLACWFSVFAESYSFDHQAAKAFVSYWADDEQLTDYDLELVDADEIYVCYHNESIGKLYNVRETLEGNDPKGQFYVFLYPKYNQMALYFVNECLGETITEADIRNGSTIVTATVEAPGKDTHPGLSFDISDFVNCLILDGSSVLNYTTENGSFSIEISDDNPVFFNAVYIMALLAVYACPDEMGYLNTSVVPADEARNADEADKRKAPDTPSAENKIQLPQGDDLTSEKIIGLFHMNQEDTNPFITAEGSIVNPDFSGFSADMVRGMLQSSPEEESPSVAEQGNITLPDLDGISTDAIMGMFHFQQEEGSSGTSAQGNIPFSGNGVNPSALPTNVTVAPAIEEMVIETSSFSTDSDVIEKAAGSCFLLEIYDEDDDIIATGSGFVAFNSHVLVTNQHVVEDGAYFIAVSDNYEHRYCLSYVLCQDTTKDIALVYFPDNDIAAPLPVSTDPMKRAEPITAIGSPKSMLNMVSTGIVSNNVTEDGLDYIMFTASVSHGSSGGAVFNDRGRVIGISSAMLSGGNDLNYAIIIRYAQEMYEMIQDKLPQ